MSFASQEEYLILQEIMLDVDDRDCQTSVTKASLNNQLLSMM